VAQKRALYLCRECGATFHRWSGRCPKCQEWDSLEEAQSAPGKQAAAEPISPPVALTDISVERQVRLCSGMPEFDRVLGGGVLGGSTVLLAGDPGVGKSTLLLQALARMAAAEVKCLYVSCEESLGQIKMRAERLGLDESPLAVSADTSLEGVLALLAADAPQVLAIDSIQRIAAGELDSAPGSLRQVSTCATVLTEACKREGCALFLVGHVTKQGMAAGPRSLEHLVDTVLYFESERFQALRVLRAVKNRFGAIDEIGVFEMLPDGLREVANPSELFLAERDPSTSGSVVTAAMEGSRALLVEIQALVGPGSYGTPERKVSGVDYRRFSMMLSVLERRAGLQLGGCDAFVNVAGGIRVFEPAADLPLVLALASSFRNAPFPADAVAVGEVGLGGEVRAVGHVVDRLKEARKLGFTRAIVPSGNAAAASPMGLTVHSVGKLTQAIRLIEGGT